MTILSLNPKEIVEYIVEIGQVKTEKKFKVLMMQGIMAGMFIALGAIAFINVLANTADPGLGFFLASAVFPVGIIVILLLGYELVTSNVLAIVGTYTKRYKAGKVLKMLGIVWIANLIGSVLVAFMAKGGDIFTPQMINAINTYVGNKASLNFYELFFRGILCNMLVCAGVMMALTSKDNVSKIATIWFPIVVFILSGAEHIVANMFLFPMAYLSGADILITDIIYNFIFVSAGNYVGGAVIMSGAGYLTQLKVQ